MAEKKATTKPNEAEICECVTCRMGYPCGDAHRRFMAAEKTTTTKERRHKMYSATPAQKKALLMLLDLEDQEGEVYVSNATDRKARTIASSTSSALESAFLVDTEDIGRIGTVWIVRLTDAGRTQAEALRMEEAHG